MQNKKVLVTQSCMPPYEEYIEAIRPLWDSHWLTNMGQYHKELEGKLREYLDVPELSLMVNGHMALEMAIQMMGFPEGAEVITTPFTFISTTHAIVRNKLEPVFCDVKLSDGTIDETKIEGLITEKTAAIIPVHVYGNVCNVEEIERIAGKYRLRVIYDAAHAFGVRYKGKGIGNYGDAAVFSFHATKAFNTVEGGAVSIPRHEMYERLYNLKNFGIRNEELVVDVGANAKMNEFCAVMGLCNLRHAGEAAGKRKNKYEMYWKLLDGVAGIRFLEGRDGAEPNHAYFPILVGEGFRTDRDGLCRALMEHNIFPRKYFYPVTADQACFKNKYRRVKLENARKLAGEVLSLPLYADLEQEAVEEIVRIIRG